MIATVITDGSLVGKHGKSGKFEFESGGLEWLTVERDQLTFEGDVDSRH